MVYGLGSPYLYKSAIYYKPAIYIKKEHSGADNLALTECSIWQSS